MTSTAPLLALDTGSPLVSVAAGRPGEVAVERAVEIGRSSERLLTMIDEVLGEAGIGGVAALGGIVVLSGPGSFTGLRVGLATALGLHQASGVPATALPTLGVLAASIAGTADEEVRVAVVDVLRDEWATQEFAPADGGPPRPLGSAERLPTAVLLDRLASRRATVVGFATGRLGEPIDGRQATGLRRVEPPPLAATALRLAATLGPADWDATALTRPLYFRPPAATLPKGAAPR